jgi:exopolysaccharide production protein ExoZ
MTLFPIGKLEPPVVWTLRHEFLFYVLFATFIIHFKSKWYWLIGWFLSPFLWMGIKMLTIMPESSFRDLGDFIFSLHNLTFGVGVLIGFLYKKNYLNFILQSRFGFLLALIISIPLLVAANLTGMVRASETVAQVLSCSIISGIIVLFGLFLFTNKPLNHFDRLGLLLGNASYAIYLTHSAVLSSMLGIWSKRQPHANPLLLLVVGCVFSLVGGGSCSPFC